LFGGGTGLLFTAQQIGAQSRGFPRGALRLAGGGRALGLGGDLLVFHGIPLKPGRGRGVKAWNYAKRVTLPVAHVVQRRYRAETARRCHSSGVEHFIGNEEVLGSIPSDSTSGVETEGRLV
jgi:hypothetical protein